MSNPNPVFQLQFFAEAEVTKASDRVVTDTEEEDV